MKDGEKGRRRGQRFPSTAIHDLISLGFGSAETFPGMRIRSREKEEDGEWQRRGGERDEERAKKRRGPYFYEEPVGGFPTPTTVKHSSRQFSSSFLIFAGKMKLAIPFVFFFSVSVNDLQENALNQQRLPACRNPPPPPPAGLRRSATGTIPSD